MRFVKSFLRGLSSYLFKLALLLLAGVAALVLTFHAPQKIEKSLSTSGVYSTFVDSTLGELQNANSSSTGGFNIPVSDPAIKAAANQSFTPQLLQHSTENVINGTYDWLDEKTTVPDFRIDLTQAKQTFAQTVGNIAAQRLASLPMCNLSQLQQLNTGTDDPFSLSCQPPGINITAEQARVTQTIATSPDFLGTPVITAANLPKNSQGKTVFESLSRVPKVYKWVNASPWLLVGLIALCGSLTLLLYDSKRRGLRNLAIGLLCVGILLLITSLGGQVLFNHLSGPGGIIDKNLHSSFQQTILKSVNSLVWSIEKTLLWFGIGYVVSGAVALVMLYVLKPRANQGNGPKDSGVSPKAPRTPPKPTPIADIR